FMIKPGKAIEWRTFAIMLISVFICLTTQAFADSPSDLFEEQTEHLETDQVERYWERLLREYGGYFPDSRPPSLMDMIAGEGLSLGQIFRALLKFLFHEILYNGGLLVSIIILTVFSMILETMQSA